MQDIRTTINDALRNAGLSSYMGQAEPVIRSLEAREQDLVRGLVSAGRDLGASDGQVIEACRNLGMSVPASGSIGYSAESNVTPMGGAQESTAPRSLEALVDAISERLDALTRKVDAAIQRAGIRL